MIRGRWTVESRRLEGTEGRDRLARAPGGMIQMSYHDIRIMPLRARSRGNRDIHVIARDLRGSSVGKSTVISTPVLLGTQAAV